MAQPGELTIVFDVHMMAVSIQVRIAQVFSKTLKSWAVSNPDHIMLPLLDGGVDIMVVISFIGLTVVGVLSSILQEVLRYCCQSCKTFIEKGDPRDCDFPEYPSIL